jgi:hypothetical protein
VSRGGTSPDGKGCLAIFLLLLAVAGGILTYYSLIPVADAFRARGWPAVTASVDFSEGRVDPAAGEFDPPFRYASRYRYRYLGQAHTSERSYKTHDWSDVARWLADFPPGGQVGIHVNPENPDENHLELPSIWILLLPVVPVGMLAGGFIGFFAIWLRKPVSGAPPAEPQELGGLGVTILFTSFALIGGGIFFGLLWDFTVRSVTAGRWPEATATIEFSRVGAHRGSKGGLTHSVDVLFSYRVDGVTYRSSRYDLAGGSSSGVKEKQEVVDHLPPGTRVPCYYDPGKPGYAVLDREFPALVMLVLIPLFFFVTGVTGLLFRVARLFRPAPRPQPAFGPRQLAPESGRLAVFAFILGACLFWNGLTAAPLGHVIQTWRRGNLDVTLAIFMVPFVLVGAAAVVVTVYQFLSFFTPRPQVTISSDLRLGGSASLEWRFRKMTSLLRRLEITLEGSEHVRYRGQKNSLQCEVHVFKRVEVLDQLSPGVEGIASVAVPADTMHSFAAEHNQIKWAIRVKGEIPIWPDVNQEFPVKVLPAGGGR